ncbi:oligosaccharide flippase family protein [Paenibacillus glycanilyticus]|uniref:Polysaccharide biosynthesis protein n=1 Tax=Paenibacillus glycanilyticus TaxID=126569 RepID=A0ABQ6GB96_9BACL|nr:oligosaccharide flippase family protein [Paenibacillus glycanilyticus]GLX66352.1 hypothetical protein MU1_06960 [Paenibacillus glycanilyticus]
MFTFLRNNKISLMLNTLKMLIGNVFFAISQFFIIFIMSKFGNSVDVGQYAFGLAITTPVYLLSFLQLRSLYISNTTRDYTFGHFLGLRILTTIIAFVITTVLALVGNYGETLTMVIILISISKFIDAISDIVFGLYQKKERLEYITYSRVLKGLITVISFSVLYISTHDLVIALVGMVIGWFVILYFYDLRKAKTFEFIKPVVERVKVYSLLKTSFPLGIIMLLMSLNSNIPQYVIENKLGEQQLGIFASLSYVIIASTVIINAMGEAAFYRMTVCYSEQEYMNFAKLIQRLILTGIGISSLGVIIAIFAGKPLLSIIFSQEIAAENTVFIWLTVATLLTFTTSFLGYGMNAARLFYIQIPLFALVNITSLIASIAWIPHHGLAGAAWAILAALTVQAIGGFGVVAYAILKLKKSAAESNPKTVVEGAI